LLKTLASKRFIRKFNNILVLNIVNRTLLNKLNELNTLIVKDCLYFILLAVSFSDFVVIEDLNVARWARNICIEHENEIYFVGNNLRRIRVIEHSWIERCALRGGSWNKQ
jgi:hypothetical protein